MRPTTTIRSRKRPRRTRAAAPLAALALALCPATTADSAGSAAAGGVEAASAPAAGRFLVASRQLRDPNFAQTVVLLLRYGPRGALGVVVNRPGETALAELLPDVEGLGKRDGPVYLGGPVESGHLTLLVRAAEPPGDAAVVFGDVYYSESSELLERLAAENERKASFRVYAGYAGWAPRQLDIEIARGDWHVRAADGNAVFDDRPSDLWRSLIPREENPWVAALPGAVPAPVAHPARQGGAWRD